MKPVYTFDSDGHTVVEGDSAKKKSGLAHCAGCGAELIAPYDGMPYWCIECSQEEERRNRK